MAQHDATKHVLDESLGSPMERFSATRFSRKETVLKQEIESYFVSDVDDIAFIRLGRRRHTVAQSLDLPDAMCDGLTYKQRLIQTEGGDCLLLARWKPERHMRRNAPDWSQKWFVEKQLFPPDNGKLFSRLEKRFLNQEESASVSGVGRDESEDETVGTAEPEEEESEEE